MNDYTAQHQAQLEQEKLRYDEMQKRKKEKLESATKVLIKGINIPFWDMVLLLVQISLAAIPAAILLAIVFALFGIIINDIL
ncbi:MAG: hypothetical protein U9R19_14760 [Bacteroidota bacterium]|nr:hypothetical protein [Bacteroidota bacterium]